MSKRKRRKKRIRGAAILILLLIIALVLTFTAPMFNISIIWVEGNSKITNNEIIEASGLKTGTNIWRINKSKAEKAVEQIPYVKEAKIVRGIPKSIKIVVTENEKKAYLALERGYAALDADGNILEILGEDITLDKPVIRTKGIKEAEIGKKVNLEEDTLENVFYTCIKEFETHALLEKLSGIDITSLADISFTTKAGMLVNLGGQDQLEYKIQYFNRILQEIGENAGGMLDLTNPEKVPYRENIE